MYDFLRKVPLFADLPDADLKHLCQIVEEVRLRAGQELFAEGSPGDRAYVIVEGELEIIKGAGGRPILLAVRKSGEVIGEMALLEEAPRMASVRARSDALLLAISQDQLDYLLNTSASASRAMMNTVLARWRNVTAALRQSEKMAQLGTLTAGVAHELNNPAAAVKRGAGQLSGAIESFGEASARVEHLGLSPAQRAGLAGLVDQARSVATRPLHLDAVSRSDREYELETWLEDRSVENAWDLAPSLVSLGYDADGLAELSRQFSADQLPAIIGWLGATYNAHNLLTEISQGAGRISEIVKALKDYSYLDQAPVQTVNVHEGLDNTLLILRNKLQEKITVKREYAPDLPQIQAYGSELNQVWTNLIDNAIDALAGMADPQITLRTRREADWVIVEVTDNGSGIPPEIQPRIFEAFFTTKPPGQGTGLGLEISYNTVVNKHKGNLSLFSQPGLTRFTVTLPVNFESADGSSSPLAIIERASDEQMRRILETARTIAVVGISTRPERPAYQVPAYLQGQGYRIIPLNPNLEEAFGERAYPDLLSIPEPVDVVEIFRRSEQVMPHVQEAIQVGAKAVWMQLGIINNAAADAARAAGMDVVMDACMMATHKRLFGDKPQD